eukprot:CAMPEP_0197661606 /NCGR_PEP_ID=MMETSP1338-20131121/51552_1 /TAXON_ID=43686 ORGANISM="Pelagodinium beii, Strain RCC1491" /NCGR_SAMPLE_ID=MMETSP1338 /ASSEMBLY_ACC=CAM_ASM_000754 /LENGTH=82 /DNA_ID=CAMNT_0043239183 /DNA_START=49 /DNA_END=294 /DNA_ORIENTATION=+
MAAKVLTALMICSLPLLIVPMASEASPQRSRLTVHWAADGLGPEAADSNDGGAAKHLRPVYFTLREHHGGRTLHLPPASGIW